MPLARLLVCEDQDVAKAAFEALIQIGGSAVSELTAALPSADAVLRVEIVRVLGQIGAEAKDAIPELVKIRDSHGDQLAESAVVEALQRIQPTE